MAIRGGPDIIEDGLVLHLDAAEPLCFRGEPTTNLMPYTNGVAGRVGWPGGAYTHSIETTGEFAGWEKIVATTTGSIANTVMRVGDVSCLANAQYTATMEFYSPYNNLKFNVSGSYGNYNGIRIGNSNRYYVTFTKNSTTGNQGWWLLTTASTPANTAISNGVIYYRRAQFEQKSYYTDFTIGTRGSTVATGGGLLDLTNNGNNGTINRAAVPSAAFYNGDNNGSLVFDGSNDYVEINDNNSLTSTNALTISVWFNASTFINESWNGLVCKGLSDSDEEYVILASPTGYYIDVGSTGPYRYVTQTLSTNTWYNFTFVHERISTTSTLTAYHNSNSISGTTNNATAALSNNNTNVTIGYARNGALKHDGKIGQVSIYNRALSANEVQQNYNATKGRFGL